MKDTKKLFLATIALAALAVTNAEARSPGEIFRRNAPALAMVLGSLNPGLSQMNIGSSVYNRIGGGSAYEAMMFPPQYSSPWNPDPYLMGIDAVNYRFRGGFSGFDSSFGSSPWWMQGGGMWGQDPMMQNPYMNDPFFGYNMNQWGNQWGNQWSQYPPWGYPQFPPSGGQNCIQVQCVTFPCNPICSPSNGGSQLYPPYQNPFPSYSAIPQPGWMTTMPFGSQTFGAPTTGMTNPGSTFGQTMGQVPASH